MDATGSPLCLACGLCCDGTLFGTVEVTAAEVEPLRRRGLTIFEEDGRQRFLQPCPHHQGDACAIYADRPETCVRFRCPLLDKLASGELSEAECLSRVARLKELLPAARVKVPAGAADDPEWRRQNAELLMDRKAFELLAKRDFIPSS